ncbi:uncharacterized protein H6S33_002325 [Morchella sextelata]|uniref:uncharacterized protein n=1 Tax=Morchella sextelata TaxID=1174677 RepID=UPI001D0404F3|nr:uncharacterized protein H6S33_002325 [Morchella sextelata]KAH0608273.1 hypothetical protein H6S33_002325 [Morchella sextelata]
MSFLTNDRYAGGDRDRDRSRGSRDRSAMESDYGRLAERPERLDGDWPYGSGRGRGRSPVPPRNRRRSRSPPPMLTGNIDRYVPRSPQPRRSRSPSRPRFDPYPHHPPGMPPIPGTKPGTIDRYVPPQSIAANPMLFDPHKLDYQVAFNYFSDWYHQENPSEPGSNRKEEVKQKYEEYKEELQARLARSFVSSHKNDEWFKERYVAGEKETVKEKIIAYRKGAWRRWNVLFENGALDGIDRESGNHASKQGDNSGADPGEEIEEVNRGIEDDGLKPVLLIKTISPTVSRKQLEELSANNLPNFQFVSLSDPNPLKKFHRIGFILLSPTDPNDPTSEPATVDESTVELLNGKSIHDDTHGDFMCHVGIHNGPPNARTRKVLNEAMSMPENIKKEAELVEKCIIKFESELRCDENDMSGYEGWEMIKDKVDEYGRGEREKREGSEEEGEEGAEGEVQLKIQKKTIDLGVEYLRRVFSFCIYCVSSSDSIHELTRKCPGGHTRRPTPSRKAGNVWGKPIDEAVEEEIMKSMKQEDEGKYRCKVAGCTKLFKAEEFWRKHLDKKHSEWLQGVEAEASLVNSYVLDPCRVHPPKLEQNSQGGFTTVQGGRGGFPMLPIGGFGGPAAGAFQPPASFNFNPAFFQGHHSAGDKYIPGHLNGGPGGAGLPSDPRRDGNGVGPMRRRDNRLPLGAGSTILPVGGPPGRERYAPYAGRRGGPTDRNDRERERDRRDRDMREVRQGTGGPSGRSGSIGGSTGPEAELAVLGRSVKSYMDLDAAGGGEKKSVEELDY